MKEEDEVAELYAKCITENTITCSNCGARNSIWDIDPYQAAEEWLAEEWRATRSNIYCPKCAKIKLTRGVKSEGVTKF